MRAVLVPSFLAILAVTHVAGYSLAAVPGAHVRPLSPEMAVVLSDAVRQSATIRSLVATLDRSDVIVYLTDRMVPDATCPRAYLRFLTSTRDARYLVAWLSPLMLAPNERVELLGHELRHALEVVEAPEVRDLVAFCTLYQRIGRESERGQFETLQARQTAAQIRAELNGRKPAARVTNPS